MRVTNYAGYLCEMLRDMGHVCEWLDPHFRTDLSYYDKVIVGVAPITSLGANRTYGALNLIYHLWETDKLLLLIDAPDPAKVKASLQAIMDKPQNLLKPFFAYRKEYDEACEVPGTMYRAVELLHSEIWPAVLAPALPWSTRMPVEADLPDGARGQVNMMSVDRYVLAKFAAPAARLGDNLWAYEPGSDRKWLSQQNVTWPYEVIPKSSRTEADSAAVELLRNSGGCLIAPDRHGTWWNTRYAMALANGVPVFTNWQETAHIGSTWSMLPQVFERYAADTARQVAATQLNEYDLALETTLRTKDVLEVILEMTRRKV